MEIVKTDLVYDEFIKKNREFTGLVIDCDGDKFWFLNGTSHREDGPALEWANGTKYWYLKGKLHREDGPAVEFANGSKEWHLNGKLHRTEGPAIEYADGAKFWYLSGLLLTEDEWIIEMRLKKLDEFLNVKR